MSARASGLYQSAWDGQGLLGADRADVVLDSSLSRAASR
jgi:hypothetical protein